jgi:hypothetical protein
MNILSIVKTQKQKAQRLSEAQAAHLRARSYRGVAMACEPAKAMVAVINGKRYSCTVLD